MPDADCVELDVIRQSVTTSSGLRRRQDLQGSMILGRRNPTEEPRGLRETGFSNRFFGLDGPAESVCNVKKDEP